MTPSPPKPLLRVSLRLGVAACVREASVGVVVGVRVVARRRTSSSARRRRRSTSTSTSSASSGSTTRRRRSTARAAAVKVDVESLTRKVVEVVVPRLGLDILGLREEDYVEMLKPVVEGLLEQFTSRPSAESLAKRILANPEPVYRLAAAYVLEKLEELTPEQLEFAVTYGGPVAAAHVQKLYRMCVKHGRSDLIPQLIAVWEQYGHPTPFTCPRCGFPAVTPDLTCMVCGAVLSEREFKEAVDFRARLEEFLAEAPLGEVREVAERGVVLLDGETGAVKPPSAPRGPLDVEVILDREEREMVRRALEERRRAEAAAAGAHT